MLFSRIEPPLPPSFTFCFLVLFLAFLAFSDFLLFLTPSQLKFSVEFSEKYFAHLVPPPTTSTAGTNYNLVYKKNYFLSQQAHNL